MIQSFFVFKSNRPFSLESKLMEVTKKLLLLTRNNNQVIIYLFYRPIITELVLTNNKPGSYRLNQCHY
jgi:hypothetical protein